MPRARETAPLREMEGLGLGGGGGQESGGSGGCMAAAAATKATAQSFNGGGVRRLQAVLQRASRGPYAPHAYPQRPFEGRAAACVQQGGGESAPVSMF